RRRGKIPRELPQRRPDRAACRSARAAKSIVMRMPVLPVGAAATLLVVSLHAQPPAPKPLPPSPQPSTPQPSTPQAPVRPNGEEQGFRFRSGVELINVTVTVSDANGRFVPGLRQEDFQVYEDDRPVIVTNFNAERVPVSLGIALDTSGSMAGTKIQ